MASTKVSPNSNIKNEIDEPEMIKINSTMKSIGDNNEDDIKNTSSNDSFADKVKRPPSWAELAVSPPPPSCNENKNNYNNNDYNNNDDDDNDYIFEKKKLMEEDNLSEVSDIFDDKEIRSPIIQRLLDRIEYLEINQEMLINDNDRQKLLNSSFEEKKIMNYYLSIHILIHAVNESQENIVHFITKKIYLQPENFGIITFCDINQQNGNIKYDYTKLIDYLKKNEPNKDFDEKHINYWIHKAIYDKYVVNLSIISVEIFHDNSHIKSELVDIFNQYKNQFSYQQELQRHIKESQKKDKVRKPRFYINSKQAELNNGYQKHKFNNKHKNNYESISNEDENKNKDEDEDEDNNENEGEFQYYTKNYKHQHQHHHKYKNYQSHQNYNSSNYSFSELSKEEKEDIVNKRSSKDCWNFLKYGKCKFGDKCHYKHDESKRLQYENNQCYYTNDKFKMNY